jgi:ribosomal protein S14
MKFSLYKDHKKRVAFANRETQRLVLKSIIKATSLPGAFRYEKALDLASMPRNSSLSRIRNRCVLTSRPRAVYKFCRLSRIKLRSLAEAGRLAGVQKATW